jgi:hypothetical protein
MNKLRCFLFALTLMISGATFASGGEIQMPGKSDPAPTPTPNALRTTSTEGRLTKNGTSTEQEQIVWQDATTLLVEILLTIF